MKTILLSDLWEKGFVIVHSGEFLFSIQDKKNKVSPVIVEVKIIPENNMQEEDLTMKNILNALKNEIQVNIEDLNKELEILSNNSDLIKSIIDKQQFEYDTNRCKTKLALLKSLLHRDYLIVLNDYKPLDNGYDVTKKDLKDKLVQMWSYIESNFDKKIEKMIVIENELHLYISTSLDDTQIERLRDNFNIVDCVDSYKEYELITLNVLVGDL